MRHYSNAITDAADKMGLLIDELLSFSRIGRKVLTLLPVDLQTLVCDVILELEPNMTGRKNGWHIEELSIANGDDVMLRIVLTNLVTKSLKFTLTRQDAQIEIVSYTVKPFKTVIYVRDSGMGFDMAHADKLFGVFKRLHHEEKFEGTGIGLPVRVASSRGTVGSLGPKPSRNRALLFIYFTLP